MFGACKKLVSGGGEFDEGHSGEIEIPKNEHCARAVYILCRESTTKGKYHFALAGVNIMQPGITLTKKDVYAMMIEDGMLCLKNEITNIA